MRGIEKGDVDPAQRVPGLSAYSRKITINAKFRIVKSFGEAVLSRFRRFATGFLSKNFTHCSFRVFRPTTTN